MNLSYLLSFFFLPLSLSVKCVLSTLSGLVIFSCSASVFPTNSSATSSHVFICLLSHLVVCISTTLPKRFIVVMIFPEVIPFHSSVTVFMLYSVSVKFLVHILLLFKKFWWLQSSSISENWMSLCNSPKLVWMFFFSEWFDYLSGFLSIIYFWNSVHLE